MSAAGRAIAVCDAAAQVAPARASDAAHEAQRRGSRQAWRREALRTPQGARAQVAEAGRRICNHGRELSSGTPPLGPRPGPSV